MTILYLLIPIALVFLAIAIAGFLWAVRSGQFDDMEGPAHRILLDDDDPKIPGRQPAGQQGKQAGNEKDKQTDST